MKCFEGMKAYKDSKEQIRLFRPLENMKRMNTSAERLAMPVRGFLGSTSPLSFNLRRHSTRKWEYNC
jgi:hypothetical protein